MEEEIKRRLALENSPRHLKSQRWFAEKPSFLWKKMRGTTSPDKLSCILIIYNPTLIISWLWVTLQINPQRWLCYQSCWLFKNQWWFLFGCFRSRSKPSEWVKLWWSRTSFQNKTRVVVVAVAVILTMLRLLFDYPLIREEANRDSRAGQSESR